jgi:hypothetical protein
MGVMDRQGSVVRADRKIGGRADAEAPVKGARQSPAPHPGYATYETAPAGISGCIGDPDTQTCLQSDFVFYQSDVDFERGHRLIQILHVRLQ